MATSPPSVDDAGLSGELAFTLLRHRCALCASAEPQCVQGLRLVDIFYIRSLFRSPSLDRTGRAQLLASLLTCHAPHTHHVLFGVDICKEMFIFLCDTSNNGMATARLHLAAGHIPPATTTDVGRAFLAFQYATVAAVAAGRSFGRELVNAARDRAPDSQLHVVALQGAGPLLPRVTAEREPTASADATERWLAALLHELGQDWGRRRNKQRGLLGHDAGTPFITLPPRFEATAFYRLYQAELAEQGIPPLSLSRFLTLTRTVMQHFSIRLAPDHGNMPLCDTCASSGQWVASARASGDDRLTVRVQTAMASHLAVVRKQRIHMQNLALVAHYCSEQLLLEAEPMFTPRVAAVLRLQARAPADISPVLPGTESDIEVWLTDRPSVVQCAHNAAGALKSLSRAGSLALSCQAVLRHVSALTGVSTDPFCRNGVVSLSYIASNVFPLGANWTAEAVIDSLLALPPLLIPARKRTVFLVLDNTVKENKNITLVRTVAQLLCHCFPDIERFFFSFEIVGHAHGALDRDFATRSGRLASASYMCPEEFFEALSAELLEPRATAGHSSSAAAASAAALPDTGTRPTAAASFSGALSDWDAMLGRIAEDGVPQGFSGITACSTIMLERMSYGAVAAWFGNLQCAACSWESSPRDAILRGADGLRVTSSPGDPAGAQQVPVTDDMLTAEAKANPASFYWTAVQALTELPRPTAWRSAVSAALAGNATAPASALAESARALTALTQLPRHGRPFIVARPHDKYALFHSYLGVKPVLPAAGALARTGESLVETARHLLAATSTVPLTPSTTLYLLGVVQYQAANLVRWTECTPHAQPAPPAAALAAAGARRAQALVDNAAKKIAWPRPILPLGDGAPPAPPTCALDPVLEATSAQFPALKQALDIGLLHERLPQRRFLQLAALAGVAPVARPPPRAEPHAPAAAAPAEHGGPGALRKRAAPAETAAVDPPPRRSAGRASSPPRVAVAPVVAAPAPSTTADPPEPASPEGTEPRRSKRSGAGRNNSQKNDDYWS